MIKRIKNIISWLRKLNEIVASHSKLMHVIGSYQADIRVLNNRMKAATDLIKDRTNISSDFHFHGHNRNQIIVTGRYRNRDYVQVFTIADNELKTLIDTLREMQRYGVVDKIDAAYDMKYVIENDLSKW